MYPEFLMQQMGPNGEAFLFGMRLKIKMSRKEKKITRAAESNA
jgi:hypothetical protein